jgi:hypothetical protein
VRKEAEDAIAPSVLQDAGSDDVSQLDGAAAGSEHIDAGGVSADKTNGRRGLPVESSPKTWPGRRRWLRAQQSGQRERPLLPVPLARRCVCVEG